MSENIIELKDMCKSFGDKDVHKGIDLSISKGENITILGGSGTGKSVLLKIINGLLKPDRGEVLIDGINIVNLENEDLISETKKIAMLFQGAALFDSLTVEENIAYPLIENFDLSEVEISEIVSKNLELVGLPGIEDKMPSDLSGGMRKRVGLARAVAMKPEVLLYDEPTTGLDPPNTNRINELIKNMRDVLGITGIIITHDVRSAFDVSDRIAFLYDGKILFVGSVEEALLSNEEIFRDFISGEITSLM